MPWLIIKQKESLSEYSYATYIYNIIADDFMSRSFPVIELMDEEQFTPHDNAKDALYVMNAPDSKEMLIKLWYSVSLPKIVKRLQIEKVIYLNGMIGPYKLIRQPQIMLLFGTDYFVNPKIATKWQQLSLKRIAKNVEYATLSFTYSNSAIDTLTTVLSESLSCNIKTLQPVPRPIFSVLSWDEREKAKEVFAEGEEYYLLKSASNDVNEIVVYLKAFSYFKRWQKSSMKLVLLVSEELTENEKFKDTFSTYLFRNDVFFFGEMAREDYHLLLAAAYGFLMLTSRDSDLPYLVEALQCGTPVLTYALASITEISNDAPYFLLGKTYNEIAQGMIAMYKSERMRTTHIEKGLEVAGHFDFSATRQKLISWLNKA
ncbi:MAG TPA: glycosyltransferase [Arachidicoccus sp.]